MPTPPDSFAAVYLGEVGEIVRSLDSAAVDELAHALADVRRRNGRLFVLGVGGGAAHASHAVNDFRKLCDFEAYAPTDNVAELTARTNDEGWETSLDAWLPDLAALARRTRSSSSRSAAGAARTTSRVNLVRAIELAREVGARVFGVVGRADGATAEAADVCIVVDAPPERRTPHVEEFQAVVWHLLVSHPALAAARREVGVGRGEPKAQLSDGAVFLDRDGVDHRARLGRGGRVVRGPYRRAGRPARPGSGRGDPSYPRRSTTVPSLSRTSQARPRERPRTRIFARPTSRRSAARRTRASRSTTTATACTIPTGSTPRLARACDCRKPEAGDAARGRRRPRPRPRRQLDDRRLRRRRRRPGAPPGAGRSSSRIRGRRIAGATDGHASTTGCRTVAQAADIVAGEAR